MTGSVNNGLPQSAEPAVEANFVFAFISEAERFDVNLSDPLLNHVPQINRPDVPLLAVLVCVRSAARIKVYELPFHGDVPAITEVELSRPRVQGYLSDLLPNEELKRADRRKGMHTRRVTSAWADFNLPVSCWRHASALQQGSP